MNALDKGLQPLGESARERKGLIMLTPELLLGWLHFPGGTLLDAHFDVATNVISVLVKHDEMPEVFLGVPPLHITPEYTVSISDCGHQIIERLPLKGYGNGRA